MVKELIKKNCVVCGEWFECKTQGRKTCSAKCYRTLKPMRRTLHELVCKLCGLEFKRTDKRALFCSAKCSNKYNQSNIKKSIKKVCIVCGLGFYVKPTHKNALFCGKKCKGKHRAITKDRGDYFKAWYGSNKEKIKQYGERYRKENPPLKSNEREGWKCKIEINTCLECGILFVSRYKRSCCSHKCDMRYCYKKYYYDKLDNIKACPICGKQFKLELRSGTKRFCSDECKKYSERLIKREGRLKRERMIKEQYIEKVIPNRVFLRDGCKCKICGKKLKMDKKVPHPSAPTIDHIKPLSCGGEHSYCNVRAAHFRCNYLRGTTSTQNDQLLLFGL